MTGSLLAASASLIGLAGIFMASSALKLIAALEERVRKLESGSDE